MKRQLFGKLALGTALAGTLLVGCETHRPVVVTPTGEVVVSSPPPAPKHEVIGTAPSASEVWVPGYWTYQDRRYVWIPGRWEVRPRPGAVWVPGHWDQNAQGWVWTPGHWED